MANVETLEGLERRVSMTLPAADIERQIDARLKQLARNVRMPGFRPGKVPMKLVAQTYGPQVRSEVLGDAVQKSFSDAVKEANLRVAGYPRIEKKEKAGDDAASSPDVLEFSATFEVYPEVKLGDLGAASIEKPVVPVDDAAVDKTIEVLRKQRTRYVPASRPAADGDRLTVDFQGTIDGQPFDGGKAENFAFELGAGRMLPDSTPIELPKSLIDMEAQQLVERASADLQARGIKPEQMPLGPSAFADTAKRRVALGLLIGELARAETLQPKPAEVRALVEREAQSYESPAEVVKWFYMQPQRLAEMEGVALEANVVKWILAKAKVSDKPMAFDELMGNA